MIISLFIAKAVFFVLRLLGRGATTLPGKIALALKYNILTSLSKGVKIICVTGTNGKTTTCALLEQGLISAKKTYFINKGGANMLSGVATAFVVNSSLLGKCKKEYAVLECDENSLPLISRYLDAEILVVTNLFRDQLDRYGEVTNTFNKISQSIENMPGATLILNGDCPLTYSLKDSCQNTVYTFGINAGFNNTVQSDSRFCPKCSCTLEYNFSVFAQLGDFFCRNCGYKRSQPDFLVSDIIELTDQGSSFIMNNKPVNISLGGVYNIYNYIAAAGTLSVLKIENYGAIGNYDGAFGRLERFENGDSTITLMLVKNPVGLSNCVKYISKFNRPFDLAFALNDNEADGRDVSWIWDGDFAPLSAKNMQAYTLGKRAYDAALRLKYSGIGVTGVFHGENYAAFAEFLQSRQRDFVILSTYTSMMRMRPYLIQRFGGKEFWK